MSLPRPNFKQLSVSWPAVPRKAQGPLALFAGLALAAVIAVFAVVLVSSLDDTDGSDGIVGGVTETPTEPTPDGGTPDPTDEPTDEPPTETAGPDTGTPAPVITPADPELDIEIGLWANLRSEWWFDTLTEDVAAYEEGQTVPFLVRFAAEPGEAYALTLRYDCAAGGAAAIDWLSGTQDWGSQVLHGIWGPAQDFPEWAVPVPDTPDFELDDDDPGVITLYGGTIPLLPQGPAPGGSCDGQRAITMTVAATDELVILVGSGHLATASDHGNGQGATSAGDAFGVEVAVEGLGSGSVAIAPAVIADDQH